MKLLIPNFLMNAGYKLIHITEVIAEKNSIFLDWHNVFFFYVGIILCKWCEDLYIM